jgi:molecular chaperone GrpE
MSNENKNSHNGEVGEAELNAEAIDVKATEKTTEVEASEDEKASVPAEVMSEEETLIAQLRDELATAQAKADEYLDRLQRSAAEFQNSRRRLENQLSDEVERANGTLIKRLIPVLDDLDLAFQNVPAELQKVESLESAGLQGAWIQGFRQIRKKLVDLLAEQGVTPVDTSGEFDPNQHEAISSEPSDSVPSGHIIAEVRAGYTYKGRVLRPALVRVAA